MTRRKTAKARTSPPRGPARGSRARRRRRPAATVARAPVTPLTGKQVRSLRTEMGRRAAGAVARWNADPQDVQRSLARLVLALVEFLRRLMERQAVRRMEAATLDEAQAEDMGLALMRLERTIRELAEAFGLDPDDLNLELGPLGRLH